MAFGLRDRLARLPREDWRENYAHGLGLQAFAFCFPYFYMASVRYAWTNTDEAAVPLNHFLHNRTIGTAEYRDGGRPNSDTAYSRAWVDLRQGPVILSHPDMGDRYFCFELSDFASDNFDYIGRRTTGSAAGDFALVQTGWEGQLPVGVRTVAPSPTPFFLCLGRTLVLSKADEPAMCALQDQYKLTPLALWGTKRPVPEDRDVWQPQDPQKDPLNFWRVVNRALAECPPIPQHNAVVNGYAAIGIGPGLDIDEVDPATQRGLARAAIAGKPFLDRLIEEGYGCKVINGWSISPPFIGRAGLADEFLFRGAIQSLSGLVAHDPEENIYPQAMEDITGARLTGAKRYTMRFDKAPEVSAFWSVTLYDHTMNLVANAIDRYKVGTTTEGLVTAPDGSITVYLQHAPPGGEADRNWLPAPEGEFNLLMRCYGPSEEMVEGSWGPPPIEPAD